MVVYSHVCLYRHLNTEAKFNFTSFHFITCSRVISSVCPQDIRRIYIKQICKQKNLTRSTSPPGNLILDHRHKLLYCLIPKVASRTIRSILFSPLTNNATRQQNNGLQRINRMQLYWQLSSALKEEIIKKYKKLIVIRHPYDR